MVSIMVGAYLSMPLGMAAKLLLRITLNWDCTVFEAALVAVIRVDELDAEGAVTTGGDGTMGAGDALGSPVLEKMTVELIGFEGNPAGLATGIPVLEKMTVGSIGFEGNPAGLATSIPVLEKTTVELIGFEGDPAGPATGIPVLENIIVELSGFEGGCV